MATYTSYLNLKKPEGGERYALADFNANMQKIDDFATLVNPKKGTVLNNSNVTSDTAILSLANGSYPVHGGVTPYLPYDYGTLIIDNTGSTAYGAFIFIGTDGIIYTRQKNNSGGWRTAWQQMALNSHINAHWLGNNTLSSVQNALLSFAQNVPDGGIRGIEFGISQASGVFGGTNYIGNLKRISASRLCVTVMNAMYATNMIIGNYKDGTWNWAEAALTSQINALSSQIGADTKWLSVPANGSTTATMSSRGLWLFYRVYRPTIVFIRTNGTAELVVGESQDLTFSLSGSTLTITNPAAWAINCWALG